jgi:co-chaperonin GroES (HSP10)
MYHVPTPLADKLIVLPRKKAEIKLDSLFIPETANADLSEGEIVSVSEKFKEFFKVGDVVLYPSGAGTGALYKGKPHLWLTVSDLWGKETAE